MKNLTLLLIIICVFSCGKDYSTKPSPFKVNDKVQLNGIDPRKSFTPYDCCTPPCVITNAYTIKDQIYWYYDLVDANGVTLTHVENEQLKKY